MTNTSQTFPWRAVIGFEVSWFLLVFFQQLATFPVLVYLLFGIWQLTSRRQQLAVVMLAGAGIAIDTVLVTFNVISFAQTAWLPVWFLVLWGIFSLALVEVMSRFLTRAWLAFLLGAIGGPLSYIGGAALSDGVLQFPLATVSYAVLVLVWGMLAVGFGYSRRWYE